MGKVAGSFYLIVLDGQPARFAAAMAHAAALYGASTALYAASSYVTGGCWLGGHCTFGFPRGLALYLPLGVVSGRRRLQPPPNLCPLRVAGADLA